MTPIEQTELVMSHGTGALISQCLLGVIRRKESDNDTKYHMLGFGTNLREAREQQLQNSLKFTCTALILLLLKS